MEASGNEQIELGGANLEHETFKPRSHDEIEEDDYDRTIAEPKFVDYEALNNTSVQHCLDLSCLCRFFCCGSTRCDEATVRDIRFAYGKTLTEDDDGLKKRALENIVYAEKCSNLLMYLPPIAIINTLFADVNIGRAAQELFWSTMILFAGLALAVTTTYHQAIGPDAAEMIDSRFAWNLGYNNFKETLNRGCAFPAENMIESYTFVKKESCRAQCDDMTQCAAFFYNQQETSCTFYSNCTLAEDVKVGSGSLYIKSEGPLSCYKDFLIAYVNTDKFTDYNKFKSPLQIYAIVVSWCNWYFWGLLWVSIFALLCIFAAKYQEREDSMSNDFWNGLKANMLWRLTMPIMIAAVVFMSMGMMRWKWAHDIYSLFYQQHKSEEWLEDCSIIPHKMFQEWKMGGEEWAHITIANNAQLSILLILAGVFINAVFARMWELHTVSTSIAIYEYDSKHTKRVPKTEPVWCFLGDFQCCSCCQTA